MSRVDLHTHTCYSDGRAAPAELLAAARARGLSALAITDHDNAAAVRELAAQANAGVRLIPAIELTCHWQGYSGHGDGFDIDLLGYFIDPFSPQLAALEQQQAAAHRARAQALCEALGRVGLALTLEAILAINPHFPGYLAIRRAIAQHYPGALERPELAQQLERAWQRLEPMPLAIAEAIAQIHALGGVAVLAHPSIIHRRRDGELLGEQGVAELTRQGLNGLEVYHYRLSSRQRQHFAIIANMLKLAVTGGSDEHGWPAAFPRLGQEAIGPELIAKLAAQRVGC